MNERRLHQVCAILGVLAVRSIPKRPSAVAGVARCLHLNMVLSLQYNAALLMVLLQALFAACHVNVSHSQRVRTMIQARAVLPIPARPSAASGVARYLPSQMVQDAQELLCSATLPSLIAPAASMARRVDTRRLARVCHMLRDRAVLSTPASPSAALGVARPPSVCVQAFV